MWCARFVVLLANASQIVRTAPGTSLKNELAGCNRQATWEPSLDVGGTVSPHAAMGPVAADRCLRPSRSSRGRFRFSHSTGWYPWKLGRRAGSRPASTSDNSVCENDSRLASSIVRSPVEFLEGSEQSLSSGHCCTRPGRGSSVTNLDKSGASKQLGVVGRRSAAKTAAPALFDLL